MSRPSDTRASPNRGVVLFGKPAAGKGTQGRILGAIPGFVHVAVGRMLREVSEDQSDVARKVRPFLDGGELVPHDLLFALFDHHLDSLAQRGQRRSGDDILVLDGIPRNLEQARHLAARVTVVLAIHLRCDDDQTLIARVRRRAENEARSDDSEETARQRLAAFRQETLPALGFYSPEIRAEVDALAPPIRVHQAVLDILVRRLVPENDSGSPNAGHGRRGAQEGA